MAVSAVLEEATHREWGPVLIAEFFYVGRGEPPVAIVYTSEGLVKKASIGDLSVSWHYDAEASSFKHDFSEET